jgi:hypothetical protein
MERELASTSDAVREYVFNYGQDNRHQDWILSPLDTWHKNPYFQGVHGPHPEDFKPTEL